MSKINIESLIGALSSDRVAEMLEKVLEPLVNKAVNKVLDEVLDKKFEALTMALDSVKAELCQKNEQLDQTMKRNAALQVKVNNQAQQIEQLEAYNRQDNLIVQGIPLTYAQAVTHENGAGATAENSAGTEELFIKLCNNDLGLTIQPCDISICHRLPKAPHQDHPAIIVRFTNRKARMAVLQARKKLRDAKKKIFINEHLTQRSAKLFASTRTLLKDKRINQTWTRNGQVCVKLLDLSIRTITTETELAEL